MYSTCTAYGGEKGDFGSTLNKNHTEAPLNAHVATGHPCLSRPNVKTREANQQQPGGHVYTVRYITFSIARPNVCFFLEDTRHIYREKSVFSHLSE